MTSAVAMLSPKRNKESCVRCKLANPRLSLGEIASETLGVRSTLYTLDNAS